ncbi:MAG: hypothetical protein P4L72_15100 [Parvibaculum sp.]|uniref:hypothetical protein n=1 Tax=Parvibaculum sp. TaxID=2024848 RepID=UPI00284D4340|nr:hypothetical protein [Parvibaculum sp.]MDR3500540.1 hypothetical protein [Parvibaculum sp.]
MAKKKLAKKKLSPDEKALLRKQKRHASDFSNFFRELGFKHIKTDNTKIEFDGIRDAVSGDARIRPLERPIYEPDPLSAVARRPEHFLIN